MTKLSAGILLYRGLPPALELLLVHPGGPFWTNKDAGAWSIPKGEYAAGEDPLAAARREFAEELGSPPTAWRIRGPRRTQTAEPEDHLGLRGARRLRSCELAIEPLRAGMAAEERATAILSRGRSRPVVHARRGERQDPVGPSAVYRPVARAACRSSSLRVVRPFALACRAWRRHWRLRPRPGSSIFLPPTPEPMDGRRIGN